MLWQSANARPIIIIIRIGIVRATQTASCEMRGTQIHPPYA